MLIKLDHLQLAMPKGEEAKARAFYGETLGLQELKKPEALRARGGCWFAGPDLDIHLGVEEAFQPARKAHPAFQVDNLDTLAARLSANKVDITWDHALASKRFYTSDPFGNRLEFLERRMKPLE